MRAATPFTRALCIALVVGCVVVVASVRHFQPSAIEPKKVVAQPIGSDALATAQAERGNGPQPTTACQQVAYNVGQSHPGSSQVVVVLTPTVTSSSGTVQIAQLGQRGWECSAAMSARVGKSGVRPLLQRRSGDSPGEVPYASAIFLHRFSYDANGGSKPTSGCVSLSHANLVSVLRALQPGVLFAIGETAWLLANS